MSGASAIASARHLMALYLYRNNHFNSHLANQHLPSFSIPKQIQFSCSVPFLSFALFFLPISYGHDVLYNHLCKLLEYSNIWYRFSSGIVLFTQSLPVQFHFISRLFFLLICFNFFMHLIIFSCCLHYVFPVPRHYFHNNICSFNLTGHFAVILSHPCIQTVRQTPRLPKFFYLKAGKADKTIVHFFFYVILVGCWNSRNHVAPI